MRAGKKQELQRMGARGREGLRAQCEGLGFDSTAS